MRTELRNARCHKLNRQSESQSFDFTSTRFDLSHGPMTHVALLQESNTSAYMNSDTTSYFLTCVAPHDLQTQLTHVFLCQSLCRVRVGARRDCAVLVSRGAVRCLWPAARWPLPQARRGRPRSAGRRIAKALVPFCTSTCAVCTCSNLRAAVVK